MPKFAKSFDRDGVHYHYIEGVTPKTGSYAAFYRLEMCAESADHPEFGKRVVLKVMPHGGTFNFSRIEGNIWGTEFKLEQDTYVGLVEAMAWVRRFKSFDVELGTRHED